MEGNLFETACRHMVRCFSNIDIPEPFTSQWFKQITMSDKLVSCATSHSVLLLNTICRTHLNGSKCANCEMQNDVNRGCNYVPLHPKMNEDHKRKQVALHLNVCPINHLGAPSIRLTDCHDIASLERCRRMQYSYCSPNCNLCHNLSSTLAMFPMNLQTCVNNTIHWPRHNYEKDHEANVQGLRCGCGKAWKWDMMFHLLKGCGWLTRSGDVICSAYGKAMNHSLKRTKSYCEFAVKTTC